MQTEVSEVRLSRRQNFFILSNSLFDSGIAAAVGPHALAVYVYLCRKANQSGVTWPSQATMAKNAGISKRMVDKCIQTLEAHKLIRRDGWNGSTREIEVLDPKEAIAPGATVAPHAVPIAPGADPHCTPCNTPIAPGADKEDTVDQDTVDQDTVIKTQHQDTTSPAPSMASSQCAQDNLLMPADSPPKLPGNLTEQTWAEFKKMRKSIRAPLTDGAERRLFAKLHELITSGENAEAVVGQSIERSWRGLFPVHEDKKTSKEPEAATWDDIEAKVWEHGWPIPGRRCI